MIGNLIRALALGIGSGLTVWIALYYLAPDPYPRLVGYGCAGSSGPLYANEEDHFPKCLEIRKR